MSRESSRSVRRGERATMAILRWPPISPKQGLERKVRTAYMAYILYGLYMAYILYGLYKESDGDWAVACRSVTPLCEVAAGRPATLPLRHPASPGTRDSRSHTTRSSDPGDRCRTEAPRDIPGNAVRRRPSPSRRVPAPAATGSLVPERDASACEVVRRHGERDPVAREHANAEPPHLARNSREHVVPVRQQHAKRGVGQHVLHDAIDLDCFFLGHLFTSGRRDEPSGRPQLAKAKAGPAHGPSPALTLAATNASRRYR